MTPCGVRLRTRAGLFLAGAFASLLITVPASAQATAPAVAPSDAQPAPSPTPEPAPTPTIPPPDSPPPPPPLDRDGAAPPAPPPKEDKPAVKVTPTGYVEAHYAANFNRPSNGITNVRGFDNRHNTFTLSNVVLGANAEGGPLSARVLLQVGNTPSTYYLGEPTLAGSGGANASGPELWKYVQEANVSYKASLGGDRALTVQMGLFPSPVGIEVFAVKDNWNWSRSNLFFGLPFYHTGLRATVDWTPQLSTTLAVYNGWNTVIDNNEAKSVSPSVTYKIVDKLTVQALYFGGIERATGAPEGPSWRHHFDLFAQLDATPWLSLAAQGDYGWEAVRMGTARWVAGAIYARVKPVDKVYVALRGDRFHEHLGTDGSGRASSPLFWGGVEWVSSGTATLDVRPHDQLSVRLEYRHDVADQPLFFGRDVRTDATTNGFIPNARTQDTLLLGATAWF